MPNCGILQKLCYIKSRMAHTVCGLPEVIDDKYIPDSVSSFAGELRKVMRPVVGKYSIGFEIRQLL